nr:MAG TPA: hypothetical protein [Caudoviricetes sp.]
MFAPPHHLSSSWLEKRYSEGYHAPPWEKAVVRVGTREYDHAIFGGWERVSTIRSQFLLL